MSRIRWRKNGRERSRDEVPHAEHVAAALHEADALAADHRAAQAVEVLTKSNRRHRDWRIDESLVELRWQAFQEAATAGPPPPWPTTVDDLTPETSLPEVTREQLTIERLRSAITNHGYLIVRGLLDEPQVSLLKHDIDTAIAAYDSDEQGEERPDLKGWYRPFGHDRVSDRERKRFRGSIMTVDSPPALFDVLEVFESIGLRKLFGEYFGERPAILARKATLRRVSPGPQDAGWHQDGAFMGQGIRSLNLWTTLTDCGEDAPSLDLVVRRVNELLPMGVGAFTAWALSAETVEEYASGAIVRPTFRRGDAIFFDHLSVHRTGMDASMPRDRHAVETWVFAPSTYSAMTAPADGQYTPRDQVPILY